MVKPFGGRDSAPVHTGAISVISGGTRGFGPLLCGVGNRPSPLSESTKSEILPSKWCE